MILFSRWFAINTPKSRTGRLSWSEMTPPDTAASDRTCAGEIGAQGYCHLQKGIYYIAKTARRFPPPAHQRLHLFPEEPRGRRLLYPHLTERKQLQPPHCGRTHGEPRPRLAGGTRTISTTRWDDLTRLDLLSLKFYRPESQGVAFLISASALRARTLSARSLLSFARGVDGQADEVQSNLLPEVTKIAQDNVSEEYRSAPSFPVTL